MRSSGILMPISALPGAYGIGSLGDPAMRFVDFLKAAGQKSWQILPIGPTGYGNSPYQSFSAFSGNPYLIDPELLRRQGLLTQAECALHQEAEGTPISYQRLFETRCDLLRHAVSRLDREDPSLLRFCEENKDWLSEYSLFMALKEENGYCSWQQWSDELRLRRPTVLQETRERLKEEIFFQSAVQYLFYAQWYALKAYANAQGVRLIGDIPIYVSPDSSDLWVDPALFQVDEQVRLTRVAGCPPDGFSASGQVWGNPLYAWEAHKRTDYAWWGRRLRHASQVYDVVRIDHFRGFAGYFSIQAGADTAVDGCWCPGPGTDFIDGIKKLVPQAEIIAEDLGHLTDDVRALLAYSGFPGMKVLQFAFDSREASDYLPHHYYHNCVVYTGTHDNTTTADWCFSAPPEDVAYAKRYLGCAPDQDFTASMIRQALACVADTAIIPMQDWLGLGREARINTPSTLGDNWVWRVDPSCLNDALAGHIAAMCTLYGR